MTLDDWRQDLRLAVRLLFKDRMFTATAVAALALGLAVNSTMFTFIDDLFLVPLPFERPEQVVSLATRDTDSPVVAGPPGFRGVSFPDFLEWRDSTASFSEMAAYRETSMVVGDETRAAERAAVFVSFATVVPGVTAPLWELVVDGRTLDRSPRVARVAIGPRYFETLGHTPPCGRTFVDADSVPGGTGVIVNARLAALYFPDADPIGRRVQLTAPRSRGTPFSMAATVVGVVPNVRQPDVRQSFSGDEPFEPVVYVPWYADPTASLSIIARGTPRHPAPASLLRDEVRAVDRDLPLSDVGTLADWLAFRRWPQRVLARCSACSRGLRSFCPRWGSTD